MRTVPISELKSKASELVRRAATEDVIITSRGKPVACLVGIRPEDVTVRARKPLAGDYSDERYRKAALRTLASIKKGQPDKGKKWIRHEEHDLVLYGGLDE